MEIILNKGEEPNCFNWQEFKRNDIPNTVLNYIVNFTNNWNPGGVIGVQKIVFGFEEPANGCYYIHINFKRDVGSIIIKSTLRSNEKFNVFSQRINVYSNDLVYTIQYRLK